jgi:hypothetical protein
VPNLLRPKRPQRREGWIRSDGNSRNAARVGFAPREAGKFDGVLILNGSVENPTKLSSNLLPAKQIDTMYTYIFASREAD